MFVVPTLRDAGGTVLVCVATRARFGSAFVVSRALFAEFGRFGTTVCCGIAFEAGVCADGAGEVCEGAAGCAADAAGAEG